MVVAVKLGVIKVVPVPKTVPPDAAAYQLIVPALVDADSETVPLSQTLPGVVPVIEGVAFTVAITAVRVDVQVAVAVPT